MTDVAEFPGRAVLRGVPSLIAALRPKQWLKNSLLFVAPLAAGRIAEPEVFLTTCLAFVSFSLVSSAGYLINDLKDVHADREHPEKRHRPIASGAVAHPVAAVTSATIAILGLLLALWINPAFAGVVVTYVACTLLYSLWLKSEPVIELALLSSGFLLRAIAGGVAVGIPLSTWFLLVAAFGSLFMGSGKRYSELVSETASRRKSLRGYTPTFLRFVWTMSATVSVITYCLWASEVAPRTHSPWSAVSIAPFVLGVMRYGLEVDAGRAEAPEEVALKSRALQAIGLVWLLTFAAATFGI